MRLLPPPQAERDADGGLRSARFDDIFFQGADGLAESRHVFVNGNDLPARFAGHRGIRPFVIGELGFGTGLNVLTAATAFLRHAPPEARLDIFSVEGFPFQPTELNGVLGDLAARWPEIAPMAERLAATYPIPRPGLAFVRLDGRITLTLFFGDVADAFTRCAVHADAWFLDGFAPRTNNAMWTEEVLAAVGRSTVPGGTAATFTVAGAVRRGLERAGFALDRRAGFGRKREMLTARHVADKAPTQGPAPAGRRIAIIGAGIAGACLAVEAAAAGLDPIVCDASGPGAGASGNPGGLVAPRYEARDNAAARFYRDAFLAARRFYDTHCPSCLDALAADRRMDGVRAEKIIATHLWAPSDLYWLPDTEGHAREGTTGTGHLRAEGAAVLRPSEALATLLADGSVDRRMVVGLDPSGNGLTLRLAGGKTVAADLAVIAAGPGAGLLWGDGARDLSGSRGQIDVFAGPRPSRILTDGHYVAPLGDHLLTGATYAAWEGAATAPLSPDADSTEENRVAAAAVLGGQVGAAIGARASVRAVTADRHPIAGGLPGNPHPDRPKGDDTLSASIALLTGLGSRGLVTAPLLARAVIAELTGGVVPLEMGGASLVAPARFAARRRRRGETASS